MKSMGMVAWGFVIVFFDIRIDGFDLLLDLVGWLLCTMGLFDLRRHSAWFGLAAVGTVMAALAALPPVLLVTAPGLGLLNETLTFAVPIAVCNGIVGAAPDRAAVRSADGIRWLTGACGFGWLGVLLASETYGVLVIVVAIGTIVAAIWFLLLLFRIRRLPTATAHEAVAR